MDRESIVDQSGDEGFYYLHTPQTHTVTILYYYATEFIIVLSTNHTTTVSLKSILQTAKILYLFSLNLRHGYSDEIRATIVSLISDSSLWSSSVVNATMNYTSFPLHCPAICLPLAAALKLIVHF